MLMASQQEIRPHLRSFPSESPPFHTLLTESKICQAWKVMGTIHVWIETDKIARDLFTVRQKKYCDRNALPATVGVREGKEVLLLMGFSDV